MPEGHEGVIPPPSEFGEVWEQFAREFVPANPLHWRYSDAHPDIVLIHAEDSNYGRGVLPFGNPNHNAAVTSHSIFQARINPTTPSALAKLDAFEAENPGIQIEGEYDEAYGYWDKLATQVAAQNAPDIPAAATSTRPGPGSRATASSKTTLGGSTGATLPARMPDEAWWPTPTHAFQAWKRGPSTAR